MNGGLLDMSGNTLGIGLGNGVLTTGVVNQVSGVITNVNNLWVGWGNGQGVYTLSGGSIYIGANGITTTSGNLCHQPGRRDGRGGSELVVVVEHEPDGFQRSRHVQHRRAITSRSRARFPATAA
jgi:hypothetical protein